MYRGVLSVVHPSLLALQGRWRRPSWHAERAPRWPRAKPRVCTICGKSERAVGSMSLVPGRGSPKHRGIEVHRSATLRPEDVAQGQGHRGDDDRADDLDCAVVLFRGELERLIGEAEMRASSTCSSCDEQIELNRQTVAAEATALIARVLRIRPRRRRQRVRAGAASRDPRARARRCRSRTSGIVLERRRPVR